ncbi:uncharacterized protein BCR38DRAFT_446717 [Pseudomassariella vexata]|uniref:Uncharacterized protein n=1 Tax=Pseudomassariella vexata TaxID=1141098 RepID=A0A1Y2DI62_9PEZI|nr:uncharacterized protein BCR38DRAFT_446717 [Pseudomassariella vexata]ORY58826.1 hypothetical protein BCR38DRAFT_446717 [Pseudomassariella vexata]
MPSLFVIVHGAWDNCTTMRTMVLWLCGFPSQALFFLVFFVLSRMPWFVSMAFRRPGINVTTFNVIASGFRVFSHNIPKVFKFFFTPLT